MKWLIALIAGIGGYYAMKYDSVNLMARTMWGEARGDGENSMRAVAHVIQNRKNRGGWYGNTIATVILKPWQFSAWNSDDPNCNKMLKLAQDDLHYKTAYEIAKQVLDGRSTDPTGGATHYHTRTITPKWKHKLIKITTTGNHYFYKEA